MAVSFESIGQKVVSFQSTLSADIDYPCAMVSNGTIGAPEDGGDIIGVVRSIEKGVAGVIVSGCVTLPYSGTAPTCGYQTLGYDGDNGGMKVATGCKSYLVVSVDTTDKTVTFFL